MKSILASVLAVSLVAGSAQAADPLSWPPVTSQTKPWAFWWWMGSAVDTNNLAHEMERYRDGGMGGVHIIPIYGAQGSESKNIPYLSSNWMGMLDFSVREGHQLDLGVDMTLGTGWCFGGPTVSDEDANANVIQHKYKLSPGDKLVEKFDRNTTQALIAFSPDGKIVDLTKSINAKGEVSFTPPVDKKATNAPPKEWTVYAISQKPSGQKVKRAAPGGEGWMLNPIYPKAMKNWLPWFDKAFANYHGAKPRATFQDSYEYRSDWSPDFFAQFAKRRGYKLQDELPSFFGTSEDDHTARLKYDYRRTVSEVMAEEVMPQWVAWSHAHGMITRYQAHGAPGNWLDLYGDADIPETEMFHNDRSILVSKFASSAAHGLGKQLTSAETGTWMEEHFTETLGEMKTLADDMFLAGVNHIVYHGLCYSPDEAGWPGWHFYASTEMNPRNSIWHDVPTLNGYISRAQSVLQSGKPDNDIFLYVPMADFWMNARGMLQPMTVSQGGWFFDQPIGKSAQELWNRGYSFDYISDSELKLARVAYKESDVKGDHYKVIVVPECKYMPLETFEQLKDLAEDGATIVFMNHLPDDVPGLNRLEARRRDLKPEVANIHFSPADQSGWTEAKLGRGFFLCGSSWDTFPRIPRETMADAGLSYIRRAYDNGWNYFIVNKNDKSFDGWVTLARRSSNSVTLDPMTGQSMYNMNQETNGTTQVYLQLPAGGSTIVRLIKRMEKNATGMNNGEAYWKTTGEPVEIPGRWDVKFISGGPALPADTQVAHLGSWTTFSDAAQNFGGTAKYEITFDAPAGSHGQDAHATNYFLDLGKVAQSARVMLNGRDYGTLIAAPFRVLVNNLKPTGNQLEIEVTSVDANRIRDLDKRGVKWKNFYDINVVNVSYRPFSAADWPLTDCGLLGPVTLTEAQPMTAPQTGRN